MDQFTVYGYVRVSSRDQNEVRQCLAMREYGIADENIFVDKQTGATFKRPAYLRLVSKLKAGDTLVIKSIDRLGRNYEEILEQWRIINKDISAYIVVLDMPLLNVKREDRDLTGTLIADIVLQLLSYVAETERTFIKQRQSEGIAAAKQRGVRFGAPVKKVPEAFVGCYRRWKTGQISARKAAQELHVSHTTFLKWVHDEKLDSVYRQ